MENYLEIMNSRSEEEFSLPKIEFMNLNHSLDRFGFSDFLRNYLGIKFTYRTFCDWDQGWNFGNPDIWIEADFVSGNAHKSAPYVTGQKNCKILLDSLRYKNVLMGGLPFCYIDNPKVKRIKNSALFILPKYVTTCARDGKVYSSKSRDESYDNARLEFIRYVSSIRNDFDKAVVCIFPPNVNSPELIEFCEKYELEVVLGASPYDKNALRRMAILFSKFEYCISNGLGSHIIYSNIMGAKSCIVEPFISYHNAARSTIWNSGFSEKYLKKSYPWLYVNDYHFAENHKEWAIKIAGCKYKLKKHELINILGWTIIGQLKGIIRSIFKRVSFNK